MRGEMKPWPTAVASSKMVTPPVHPNRPDKVVLGCLDGRRLMGYLSNLSATDDRFRLFPEEDSTQQTGPEVELSSLKAIFFVNDFEGDREHKDSCLENIEGQKRKIEITFRDGEKIAGTTEAYHPQNSGFYLFPADPDSNSARVFIVNSSVQDVKFP
jgi:hypothetical protein